MLRAAGAGTAGFHPGKTVIHHPARCRPDGTGAFLPPALWVDPSMNPLGLFALAGSMSMDAFAASIGKGASLHRPRFGEALRIGAIFGIVAALAPLIGWAAGLAASDVLADIDHWIAFALLVLIGSKMCLEGLRRETETPRRQRHSFSVLVATAIATNLDAAAVGVTLAFMEADIRLASIAIGLFTFAMATIGALAGRVLGPLLGRSAEAAGGLGLIAIGSGILYQHLAVL
jgi:putative Mn2+ efflux pump MntP